jgi:hypothetical protein
LFQALFVMQFSFFFSAVFVMRSLRRFSCATLFAVAFARCTGDVAAQPFSLQSDTTFVDPRGDTLLVRKTLAEWSAGVAGAFLYGVNTGLLRLPADPNDNNARGAFFGGSLGDAQAVELNAFALWRPSPDGVSWSARVGWARHSSTLFFPLPARAATAPISPNLNDEGRYFLAQSDLHFSALNLGVSAHLPLPWAYWSFVCGAELGFPLQEARAQTLYYRPAAAASSLSPPPAVDAFSALERARLASFGAIAVETPPFDVPLHSPAPRISIGVERRFASPSRIGAPFETEWTAFAGARWQPLLSSSDASAWGVFSASVGISFSLAPARNDTLSLKPFVRFIPIEPLAETPLETMMREEPAVTGRVVSAREMREAVLEERVFIYRPSDAALIHGIPPAVFQMIREYLPQLLSGARCRFVLTVPTAAEGALVEGGERTLRLLGDYCLRRRIEPEFVQAGVAEHRLLSGEALQLRVRIWREARSVENKR